MYKNFKIMQASPESGEKSEERMAVVKQGHRILVHLQRVGVDSSPVLGRFTQCVLDYFRQDNHILTSQVSADLVNNCLVISDDVTSRPGIKLKHPPFCPIHHMTSEDVERLSDPVRDRGIDVGAAIILESSDNKILLTRRADHMRTFPGIWVPPGGHVEEDESFMDAALRELHEETGLNLNSSQYEGNTIHTLAIWESVFPPKLTLGQPKRHHLVLYLYGKLTSELTSDSLNQKIKLDPEEAGACGWFDRKVIEGIVSAKEEKSDENFNVSGLPDTFRAIVVKDENKQEESDLPLAPLLRTMQETDMRDRVSTGTKFALEEWLQTTSQM